MLSQVEKFNRRYGGFFRNVSEGTRVGLEIMPLNNHFGQRQLRKSLLESQGIALVVVHPFFPEGDSGLDSSGIMRLDYARYTEELKGTVRACVKRGIPLVVFETKNKIKSLPDTLLRMGVESGRVYIVPTSNGGPGPIHAGIDDFSRALKDLGMGRAVILGSYFLVKEPYSEGSRHLQEMGVDSKKLQKVVKNFGIDGCVGDLVRVFLKAGILPVIGAAAYPGRRFAWRRFGPQIF